MNPLRVKSLLNEAHFSASRSSGSGGQNVNKVNTKVELRFNIPRSFVLSENEKKLLVQKLTSRLTKDGDLILTAQTERTQFKNKEQAINRFINLIHAALKPVPKRRATKPTKASRKRRVDEKKKQGQKKAGRNPTNW